MPMTTEIKGKSMYIGGQWVRRDKVIEVQDPQDNSLIDTVPKASVEDMRYAIEQAKCSRLSKA